MKTKRSIVEKLDIECMPEDMDRAIQEIQAGGYVLKRKKRKNIWGSEVCFLVGEKIHRCG